jgi:polysaccharide pyruvyl transferase WcaK-like protein
MKIVIAGNYGAGNLGDELILEGLLETLNDIVPKAKITVLTARPQFTKKRFSKYDIKTRYKVPAGIRSLLKNLLNGQLKKTLRAIKKSDYFILGGGGLFDETTKKAIWIWGTQARAAYHYKKPVIMYGQSISNLKSNWAKKRIKKYFRKAELIAVRDLESKQDLKRLIRGKKIISMPDLIFKIRKLQVASQSQGQKTLIALRALTNQKAEEEIQKFIKNNEQNLTHIQFQKTKENVSVYTSNLDKILNKYHNSKAIIATRLHAILMAVCTGTPFIAINYNPKVQNILDALNLAEYMINPEEITAENLQRKLQEIKENHKEISQRLKRIAETQLQKHENVEKHLSQALNIKPLQ